MSTESSIFNDNTENLEELENENNTQKEQIINLIEELKNETVKAVEANQSTYLEDELTRLRDLVTTKTTENIILESKLQECEQQYNLKIEQLNQNFTMRLEQTLKKFQDGHKDKTSSLVMKYAEAEKRCIDLNRNIEHIQSKLQDSIKEKQNLNEKCEKFKHESIKLNLDYEKKCQDLLETKKEYEKSIVLSEAKEKACQLKLKQEIELHSNTKIELESMKLKYLEKITITESNESIIYEEDKEKKKSDDEKFERTIKELNALKSQLKDMFEERITLKDRLQCMEQERKLQESSFSKYKETLQSQKQMNKDLLIEILQLRELQETLTKEKIEKESLEHKLKLLNIELTDLQSDMITSQEKQNELLLFTSKLTEKNSQLQSENTSLNEKLICLQNDYSTTYQQNKQTSESTQFQIEKLSEKLKRELDKNKNLIDELLEKDNKINEMTIKLEDSLSESTSLKKKHAANVKDLSRQLQLLQKKSSNESKQINNTSSRTNSMTSLNDNSDLLQPMTSNSNHKISDDDSKSFNSETQIVNRSISNNHFNEVICGNDDVYVVDIDKQKIIEKIVKLQKTLAKRNEKIDFLQDHVNQLTNDLKRKTKVIQAYAMNEEVGQFTSEMQDAIKREMSRKTGSIMSTLYNKNNNNMNKTAQLMNGNMTMELCIEINGKLQALLEDTLIKNLTLKENLETLGQEISRLSKENRQIKLNSL